MDVSSLSPATGGPSSSDAVGSTTMGKDQFLKLLMAQLANQDPTAPTDSQAFVAQLAQFSSLEMQQNANNSLDSLLVAQAAANATSTVALVGKEAVFKCDTMTLQQGQPASMVANLSGAATQITAVITDSTGKVVRTLALGAHDAGDLSVTWDGKDDTGKPMAAGDYKVRITAAAKDGTSVAVDERMRACITGVSFANGFSELLIGDKHIKLADVVEVEQPTTP